MSVAVDFAGSLWSAAPLAIVAGTHAATWGAYKDSPYEGYHPGRQVRTLIVAGVAAVLGVMSGLVDPETVVPAVGVVYTLERLATEWWKTIVRVDDQSAYTIPMRLGLGGRPVDARWVRYSVGALVLVVLVMLGAAVHAAQGSLGRLPWWVVVPSVGGLGGWATAVGGAWKDAPIEGFSGWKFLRSPAVATAWAVPLSLMTGNWVTLCLAAGGLAVFSIETYKTFWTGGRAPGKFAGQPQRDLLPATRHLMGVLHAGVWLMFAAAGLREALSSIAPSLRITDVSALARLSPSTWIDLLGAPEMHSAFVSSTLVAGASLLAAGSVLRANMRLTGRTEVPILTPAARSTDVPRSMSESLRRRSAGTFVA